jgi:hypothetical protein
MSTKPKILALMPPNAVGEAYLEEFRKEFVLDVRLSTPTHLCAGLANTRSNRFS